MAIGITGARGVLGRRLCEALGERGAAVAPFEGDIRDFAALTIWAAACTQIVHAAALVPTDEVKATPGAAIAVNVAGTANVARAAEVAGVHLTYLSTSHVYASSNAPLAEDAPIGPISLYGLTKWQGEQWVERLVDRPLVVRIFSYFDSRQPLSYLVPALFKRICEAPPGAELPLVGYRSVRDMTDARWLAGRLADLVLAKTNGRLNIGTGTASPIAAIAARLADAAGRSDLSWVPADDQPGDKLVANAEALGKISTIPTFSLGAAMRLFVNEAKP